MKAAVYSRYGPPDVVNHDAARIATEVGDVFPNPAKRRHQVGHRDVQRIGVLRPADRTHQGIRER